MSALKKSMAALIGVFVVLVAGLFFAASSGAYPAGVAPTVTVSDTTPSCGETVTVSGANYQPGETVTVTDNAGDSATTSAGSDGTFSVQFTVTCPNGVEPTTISARGSESSGVDAVTISTSSSSSSSGSGGLSNTGVAVIGIGALGVVLLVGGGLVLLAGRRRTTVG